ncbi:MAG: thioredoxin family protein [Candidatus Bathyarchaeota archaeon]|jgi:hypothetical protein
MELKVFTLPTCTICPTAKRIALEVAHKYNVAFRVVDMSTKEGLEEGLTYRIMSTPSIALGDDVVSRGRLVPKEMLEEEVEQRIRKWKARISYQETNYSQALSSVE